MTSGYSHPTGKSIVLYIVYPSHIPGKHMMLIPADSTVAAKKNISPERKTTHHPNGNPTILITTGVGGTVNSESTTATRAKWATTISRGKKSTAMFLLARKGVDPSVSAGKKTTSNAAFFFFQKSSRSKYQVVHCVCVAERKKDVVLSYDTVQDACNVRVFVRFVGILAGGFQNCRKNTGTVRKFFFWGGG